MTDKLREAAKQALEALEGTTDFIRDCHHVWAAVTTLRATLAECSQDAPKTAEPVGIDWSQAGSLMEAAASANIAGFTTGTTNWAAHVYRFMLNAAPQPDDTALLRQARDTMAYWLEHGETPGAHDMIQRTHDALQKRLK